MTDEDKAKTDEDKAINELRDAWDDLTNSVSETPVIYDDGKDDGTNVVRAVWVGKPVSGPNASAKTEAICNAKMEEYERIGAKAFEDTEPLEDALLPGEVRFDPPLGS
jgi:hypothetical protein